MPEPTAPTTEGWHRVPDGVTIPRHMPTLYQSKRCLIYRPRGKDHKAIVAGGGPAPLGHYTQTSFWEEADMAEEKNDLNLPDFNTWHQVPEGERVPAGMPTLRKYDVTWYGAGTRYCLEPGIEKCVTVRPGMHLWVERPFWEEPELLVQAGLMLGNVMLVGGDDTRTVVFLPDNEAIAFFDDGDVIREMPWSAYDPNRAGLVASYTVLHDPQHDR